MPSSLTPDGLAAELERIREQAARPARPAVSRPSIELPQEHRPASMPPARSPAPRARLIVAAAVVTAMAVASIAYATTRSSEHKPAGRPATSVVVAPPRSDTGNAIAQALAWAKANLAPTTAIRADRSLDQRLIGAGFSAVTTAPDRRVDWEFTDSATPNPGFVTIADFGALRARSAPHVPTAKLARLLADDKSNRRVAGAALAGNPHLETTRSVRALLAVGDIDLRAATVLALLASGTAAVRLLALNQDPAEAAAARPRRTLVLDSTRAAIKQTLVTLPSQYRPVRVAGAQAGPVTLQWSAAVHIVQLAS